MPYTSENVPSYVPGEKAAQWAAVWNSAHEKAKKDGKSDEEAESSAFAQANGVAGPKSEKAMQVENEFGFFKLVKADSRTRTVVGIAAAEVPDKVGEIFDYESSKPLVKAWSDERRRDTEGKSLGNVREQHTSRAVGKLTDLLFNDAQKQIEVAAEIADGDVWKKVEDGIYSGFSFGGRYEKKWVDGQGLKRYTARPFELTVCDNPCIPGSAFQMVKTDGEVILCKFANVGEEKSAGESEKVSKKEGTDMLSPEEKTLLEKAAGLVTRVDELEKLAQHHKEAIAKIAEHHAGMGEHIHTLQGVAHEKVAKAAEVETKPNAEVESLKKQFSDFQSEVTNFFKTLTESIPAKSDLPAGAMAKAAISVSKSEDGKKAEDKPREVTTGTGLKVDLNDFRKTIFAKPISQEAFLARQ